MTVTTQEPVSGEDRGDEAIVVEDEVYKSQNQWVMVVKRLRKNKVAKLAFYYIVLNMIVAIIYPILISNNPTVPYPAEDERYGGGVTAYTNLKYPFGTSQTGYDAFSRILVGAETSMLVGILATSIATIIGVLVGLFAGYYQGRVEEVLMRLTDLFLAVPFLVIALIILRIIQSPNAEMFSDLSHVTIITILIGSFSWAGLARLVTANVKQVSSLEYVHAVKIMGAKDRRILFLHILPNVLASIIVITALLVGSAILSEAGLAFLGFADPANTLSWGVEVSLNQDVLRIHPDLVLIPGFAIFFLVLAVNIFGDALRDALDPRLKE